MLKKELNESIINNISEFISPLGFKPKKNFDQIRFVRKLSSGFEYLAISSSNYYDTHYLNYGFGKRIESIEKIVLLLEAFFEPNLFLTSKSTSTYYLNATYYTKDYDRHKQPITDEESLMYHIDIIKDVTQNFALDLFQKLDDINYVDHQINGEGANFWLNETNKPFGLHSFETYRIIIAKLVKSAEEYKKFIEKIMALEEEKLIELKKQEQYKNLTLEELFIPRAIKKIEEI
ncbi:hypothetical protein [Chryseobacterium sp. MFBS3-17]|uniref:hypothetical protein n=1 Tax=Chryseobacterium sp. MFBS3-17 TaxID=2886689 RepID=UPI001D0E3F82|nr:hypothetical protein [Chryseobacterium sp. MFBS3-17]MCC2590612.1 hypothetical protein [Chryseobacterium sp. MFBS3-17]